MRRLYALISLSCLCLMSSFVLIDEREVVRSMEYKKGVYSGEVSGGLPHGKGCLTDSKGTVYDGDFRNGLRHGLITVTKSGGEPVPQVWYKDKLRKDIPAGPDETGVAPKVTMLGGKEFGYGSTYDPQTKTVIEGFFIDGKLEGQALTVASDYEMDGWYTDGQLGQLHIRWRNSKWKTDEFIGVQNGDVRKGVRRMISPNDMYIRTYIGEFVDGKLHGAGECIRIAKRDTFCFSGTFTEGKLWGEGRFEARYAPSVDGMKVNLLYKGELQNDKPQGKGCEEVSFKAIKDGKLRSMLCGVKISEFVDSADAQVRIEGDFKDGNLVKGKVSISNGTVMYGTFEGGELAQGRLVKKYSDGSSYDGECRNGKFHGYGRLCYADGTVYEGKFVDGFQEGARRINVEVSDDMPVRPDSPGTIRRVFEFKDIPVQDGVARLVRAAGVKIMVRGLSEIEVTCKGTFDGDVLSQGKVTISDGNWMEGAFEDGVLIKGRGRTVDKYGTIYTGDIKDGFPHGNGKCEYSNGTWFEGKFVNGNRMQGTYYSADNKVIKIYK